jgi:3-phenylpropionate/trans-cinnamate dioxygenase ferredoxin reductase component
VPDPTIVIVGAGLAGAKAAEALRDHGHQGRLVLVGAERHLPYERPPLSKSYLKGESPFEEATVHDQGWYDEHRVELRLGEPATALDPARHLVTVGGEQLSYDKLLLATGSSPRRLDLPGADLDGVLTLRNVEDSDRLREAFGPGARVVLVGGGWIGLEVAAAAREAGAEVTVLEALELPLVRVLGRDMAMVFADLHREHGVDLRTGVTVEAIEAAEDGRRVRAVRLADGTPVPATLVVVGIGAAPNVGLADGAGLEVDNGVLVDAAGRTSDPDVFAVGDIANAEHPVLGTRIRVEHWANALNQPAAVAAAMLGEDAAYDTLPYFYTDQYDLGMEYSGNAGPDDEVVVRGDRAGREFLAFWLRDGRVTAGMGVNVWDRIDDINALILAGGVVDRTRLADPSVPLAELTAGSGS